jgi:hypothetical protein
METNDLKDIFLSYNKADKKWVHDLAARVESETLDGTPASRKDKGNWFIALLNHHFSLLGNTLSTRRVTCRS